MNTITNKATSRLRRRNRIRARVIGTPERPRLSVFKSNGQVYAQVIDDSKGVTLAGVSSLKMKGTKSEKAVLVGKEVAEKAQKAGVKSVVFDRSGYVYTGVIKALADSAREGGLTF